MMNGEDLFQFVGRRKPFAKQLDNGAYVPVKHELSKLDLEKHLKGLSTYGTYVIREDGLVNFACIDIDTEPGSDLEPYKRLGEHIVTLFPDFKRCFEFSGRRGYHVWVFPENPETPRFMRELCKTRLKKIGFRNIEIYPKQDQVDELKRKLGNLIKIPCGKHRRGTWSKILGWWEPCK